MMTNTRDKLWKPFPDEPYTCHFSYSKPPSAEINFNFSSGQTYYREVHRGKWSGHFISIHEVDTESLYSGDYVNSNYKDINGIHKTFNKIISLDPSKSDNTWRVQAIQDFARNHFKDDHIPTLLDVGSGLGVFPYAIKKLGWQCIALDPDPTAVEHIKKHVQVDTIHADFVRAGNIGRFDIITLNKVLEHVYDPLSMLRKCKEHINDHGFVYVELPDGEIAARDGKDREEFTIDHLHIFSFASLAILAEQAGFSIRKMFRIKEPSTKYTLRSFLTIN